MYYILLLNLLIKKLNIDLDKSHTIPLGKSQLFDAEPFITALWVGFFSTCLYTQWRSFFQLLRSYYGYLDIYFFKDRFIFFLFCFSPSESDGIQFPVLIKRDKFSCTMPSHSWPCEKREIESHWMQL